MQIDRIYFPVRTLGFGDRIGIWTVGCPKRCKNCSNPELQNENPDKNIALSDIFNIIEKCKGRADGITITGGEPFYQPDELYKLLSFARNIGINDILIFTGYSFSELQQNPETARILSLAGAVVDGEYIDELNDNIGIRGSSNQRLYILDKSLEERYKGFEIAKRQSEIINSNGRIMSVGIPKKSV